MAGISKPVQVRGQVIFNEDEYKPIAAFLEKEKITLYALLKKATFEYIERHGRRP